MHKDDFLVDEQLPHLIQAIDRGQMAQVFESHFQREYPQQGLVVEDCDIEKISYRPHKHSFNSLYRLQLLNHKGHRSSHWFFAQMHTQGAQEQAFAIATAKAGKPIDFWQPVHNLSAIDAIVWAFPHDPELPHLCDVVQSEYTRNVIQNNTEALGLASGIRCNQVKHRQVKYMPTRRCVLFLEAEVRHPRYDTQPLHLYSKTYRNAESRHVYDAYEYVRTSAQEIDGQIEVPRSLLHIDGIYTYWQEVWKGRSLHDLYGTQEISAMIPRVAAALASFHRCDLPQLGDVSYILKLPKETRRDAKKITNFFPDNHEQVLALGERIAESLEQMGPSMGGINTPLHGTFRMSQLLGNGERLAMTDLDSIGLGDPHYDVAEFMATVLYQYVRRNRPLHELKEQANLFRNAYQVHVPWELAQHRLDGYIAAFLFRKIRRSLKNLELTVIPKLDVLFELIEYHLQFATTPVYA